MDRVACLRVRRRRLSLLRRRASPASEEFRRASLAADARGVAGAPRGVGNEEARTELAVSAGSWGTGAGAGVLERRREGESALAGRSVGEPRSPSKIDPRPGPKAERDPAP